MDPEYIIRNVPTEEKILRSSKRVRIFKAVDCILILSKMKYEVDDIKKTLQKMLDDFKIIKVKIDSRNSKSVDIQCGKVLNASDIYMWTEEKTNYWSIFMGLAIVALILCLVMFQLWPLWMKRLIFYARYPILAFFAFLVAAAIIRCIVFGITYFTHSPGLWLLPNLFADCGFFESFVPLYCWADDDVSHKKDKKKND